MPTLSKTYPSINTGRQTYEGVVLGMNPVGYWPLSETDGTNIEDLSANGNNGTTNGSPTMGAKPGAIDRVAGVSRYMNFGGNSHVDLGSGNIPPLDGASGLGISAWVRIDGVFPAGFPGLFSRGASANRVPWVFGNPTNQIMQIVLYTTTANLFHNGSPLTANVWQHVAWSWASGGPMRTYINAVAGPVSANLGGTIRASGQPNYLCRLPSLGQWADDAQHIAVWDRALTVGEIDELYLTGRNGV